MNQLVVILFKNEKLRKRNCSSPTTHKIFAFISKFSFSFSRVDILSFKERWKERRECDVSSGKNSSTISHTHTSFFCKINCHTLSIEDLNTHFKTKESNGGGVVVGCGICICSRIQHLRALKPLYSTVWVRKRARKNGNSFITCLPWLMLTL